VIIRDLNFVRVTLAPLETNAVLIVDANAVLAFAIAAQPLKPVAGRNEKVCQGRSRVQHLQFLERGFAEVRRDALGALFLPLASVSPSRKLLITPYNTNATR